MCLSFVYFRLSYLLTYPIIFYDLYLSYLMTYPYIFLYLYILFVLYQTDLSPVGLKNRDSFIDTHRYFLTYTLLHIKSTYISISCSYLYPFLPCISFNFNQAISTLGTTIHFSDKIWALNSIWLDSRLNELSIESKNTHNGFLTKELCKLQAVKKISNLKHLQ